MVLPVAYAIIWISPKSEIIAFERKDMMEEQIGQMVASVIGFMTFIL
jgi:hypothetical protein